MAFSDMLNNPMMGLAAGLLSGRDPGQTFGSGLNRGLLNMQNMQQNVLQGQMIKAQLDAAERKKQQEEAQRKAVQGYIGTPGTPNTPYQNTEMFPGESPIPGLLNAGQAPTGMYAKDPEIAGLLGVMDPNQGAAFLGQAALQGMKDTSPDLIKELRMFQKDPVLFGMAKDYKAAGAGNTTINNIPKADFGYVYNDPKDPSKGVSIVPGSKVDTEKKQAQKDKETTLNLYETAMSGLKNALASTETGPIVGMMPAVTSPQQTAEGAVAAIAPVMKQLFRQAGEGVFTDRDQQLLLDMVPKRTDLPSARDAKLENIDAIVRAKLGMPPKETSKSGAIQKDGWSIEPAN